VLFGLVGGDFWTYYLGAPGMGVDTPPPLIVFLDVQLVGVRAGVGVVIVLCSPCSPAVAF